MRFVVMHKVDADMEAGVPPDGKIIEAMGKLIGDSARSGVFLDGTGLHRSAQRARIRFSGNAASIARGPYAGGNELVASFVMIRVRSIDEAIEVAKRFGAVLGDGEIEIGPVVEAWDLGMVPRPEKLDSGRFLLLFKGDRAYEAGATPPPRLAELVAELERAGVALSSARLAPSSNGARLASGRGQKAKRSFTDGPFAESKELVAGFSIIEVETRDDAIDWAWRYAEILDDNEVDLRVVADPA